MLPGVVRGFPVVNTSAAPGATPKIRIRVRRSSPNVVPAIGIGWRNWTNSVPVTAADLNSPDVIDYVQFGDWR